MNRKDFFKKLGLGAMVVFTAPKLLAKDLNCSEISNSCFNSSRQDGITDTFKNGGWYSRTYLTDNWRGEEHHYNEAFDPMTADDYEEAAIEAAYQLNKAMYEEIWRMKL